MDEHGLARRGVIVRHLVLPNDLAGSEQVLRFLATLEPRPALSLMAQFYPPEGFSHPLLQRGVGTGEYARVVRLVHDLGLDTGWIQQLESHSYCRPDFTRPVPFDQPPLQAGERSEKHKTVVVITDKGRTHHDHGEEIDLRALEALKNLNIRVRVNDKRIKIDLRGLEQKIERSAKRWERKLDRKMEDLDSRGILKAIRILEDLDLDFDFDFDFDFDWDRD